MDLLTTFEVGMGEQKSRYGVKVDDYKILVSGPGFTRRNLL